MCKICHSLFMFMVQNNLALDLTFIIYNDLQKFSLEKGCSIFSYIVKKTLVLFVITTKENCCIHTAHTFSYTSDFDYFNIKWNPLLFSRPLLVTEYRTSSTWWVKADSTKQTFCVWTPTCHTCSVIYGVWFHKLLKFNQNC
jgi:hypothetical protein